MVGYYDPELVHLVRRTSVSQLLETEPDRDISSLRLVACGGSAVPVSLMRDFEDKYGVPILQAWGMTETSPLATVARPPAGADESEQWALRATQGRAVCGVQLRIHDDDDRPVPHDNTAVGEIQVRGPWITGSYFRDDDPDKFDQGWLRTGDVGRIDGRGFMTLTDRAKDVIKSGGEWISSVELENILIAHPSVVEAVVVGVPDDKWQERPLAAVVVKSGAEVTPAELCAFLDGKVAKWWLPERWTFVDDVPRTSVGKYDKKLIRSRYAAGEYELRGPT
ncbi:MAG: AMP-binding protein [Rhodococcus sp. (in: high G+C Gram-positive bacteria)]